VDRVIVATDDMRIAEAAFGFGAEVALTSPRCVSGTDRCAEVASRLRGFRHIVNVQGDEPLVDPALISKLAQTLDEERSLDMATAATPFAKHEDPTNPNAVKVVVNRAGNALYFSRSLIPFPRDDRSVVWMRHLGIYAYTVRFLLRFVQWPPGHLERIESLEQLRALENGAEIRVLRTKGGSVGVDTPADVEVAEALLRPKRKGGRGLS
jgi:3-deoxy-manno-octulosonate cytidylyltransferase (CMP-KDO synthetase)